MRLSANGRKLIQGFEGLSLKAYPDAAGYSIGYGHYGAKPGDVITREEADRLFDQDAVKYETAVSLTTPDATQDQFDAMTSLTYNIGTAGFAKSTVAARHNMGDYAGAADAFRMWNKSQGNVLSVLTNRREKERSIYLNGHGYYSSPPMSTQPSPIAATDPIKGKGGIGQFFIGLIAALGLTYAAYTRTDLLQGKFVVREKPRKVKL
jgi:lysozyme